MEENTRYSMEELLPVVADLADKYTSKESTSVTNEQAARLMGAVLYCIHELEQSQGMLSTQEKMPVELAYQLGYQLVFEKVVRTRRQFEQIQQTFCDYGNHGYSDTVIKGMPGFFLRYDAKFCPQNHILTLDYPLLIPVQGEGVDAIHQYLSCVELEQRFLHHFPEDIVRRLGEEYHADYADLYVNVCEIVLQSILSRLLAVSEQSKTNPSTKKQLIHRAKELLHRMMEEEYHSDLEMEQYLSHAVADITIRWMAGRGMTV